MNSSPPHAGQGVLGPDALAHALGQGHQDPVPQGVAAGVVDVLEVVQIDEQQGEAPAMACIDGYFLLQAVEEQGPVGQAGQGCPCRPTA